MPENPYRSPCSEQSSLVLHQPIISRRSWLGFAEYVWHIEARERRYVVRLQHSWVTGFAEVTFSDCVVYRRDWSIFDIGFVTDDFVVDDSEYHVRADNVLMRPMLKYELLATHSVGWDAIETNETA